MMVVDKCVFMKKHINMLNSVNILLIQDYSPTIEAKHVTTFNKETN